MDGTAQAEDFIPAGLASLGIEADETDLAVMSALHRLFWPAILELLALEIEDVPPEPVPDLSRGPR
jgi:hypothetical protein